MNINYDQIVVGSCLNATLYAFIHHRPLLFTHAQRPFRFDYLSPEIDLDALKIDNQQKTLCSFESEHKVGVAKEILWERLLFLLALDGNLPLSNLCHSMRDNGNSLVCSNEYSKIAQIRFDECVYFGDPGAFGLARQKDLDSADYICYDWVAFNRGGKHDIDYLETEDQFVNKVWFYPTDRIDGNSPVKDACVVSCLSKAELLDFDYSQTMARFKLVHELEARGMKGLFNGYGPNGKAKYYKFRTSSIAREKHCTVTTFEAVAENVKIAQDSEESLLESLPSAFVGYDRLLRHL